MALLEYRLRKSATTVRNHVAPDLPPLRRRRTVSSRS